LKRTNYLKKTKRYSPLNPNIKISMMISPWTVEEFFHAYITQQSKEIKIPKELIYPDKFFEKEIKKRTEILTKIKSYVYLFSQEKILTRKVNQIFLSLIFSSRESNILSIKKNDKKINSKDLLHMSYPLYFHTDTFITCDNGFELLKQVNPIKRMLMQYNLKEIIILDEKLKKINKKITF
jgi:hypothetical protein